MMNLNEVICADGGVLREVYKDPGWGQIVIRTVLPGARTEPHRHPETDEWWLLLRGSLYMTMEGIGTFKMHQHSWTHVAPGIGHLCENLGDEEVVYLFTADRVYDPDSPDKEPWDEV